MRRRGRRKPWEARLSCRSRPSRSRAPSTCGRRTRSPTSPNRSRPRRAPRTPSWCCSIDPFVGKPDYNFDYDMADQAIKWIKMQKSVAQYRPFFFSLQKGKPVFHSNFCDLAHYEVAGTEALAPAKHTLGMDF